MIWLSWKKYFEWLIYCYHRYEKARDKFEKSLNDLNILKILLLQKATCTKIEMEQ